LSLCLNLAPHHEGVLGNGGIAYAFLTSALGGGEWSASRAGRYIPRESPWYPFNRRPGGTQSRSERGSKEKNSQPLPGLEYPFIQPVAKRYTTELSWLKTLKKVNFYPGNDLKTAQEIRKHYSGSPDGQEVTSYKPLIQLTMVKSRSVSWLGDQHALGGRTFWYENFKKKITWETLT